MLENPHPPEVRIICPGKVFRRDNDITHSPMFQQVEGLVVGHGHHASATSRARSRRSSTRCSARQYPVRFRSSYFPYTEPSVEVDLGCIVCGGSGGCRRACRVCKATGWLEILGSGMVHPAVFEAVNARLGRSRLRPRAGHRLRLRPRHRARGDGAPRHRRHPALLRERPALPGAVRRMKVPLSWLKEFVDVAVEPRAARRRSHRSPASPSTGSRRVGARDRPRPRHHDEPRRLHERLRRGARGGGALRPAAAAARTRRSPSRAPPAAEALDVAIEAPDLCPRFCARVLDVRLGPSPAWLRDRLELVGRPLDQQRRRPDELRDARDGPADATPSTSRRCRAARCACAGRARASG